MTPHTTTPNIILPLDITLPRTLDSWAAQFSTDEWQAAQVEGWLFEGIAARRAAETQLMAAGVKARFRSAYKPLVHYFLEEIDCTTLAAVTVTYPVHPQSPARRFLLEAYPLAAMLPGCALTFVAGTNALDALGIFEEQPAYQLAITLKNGKHFDATVFAPNRVHVDHINATLLSPTGWLRATKANAAMPNIDAAQQTDYEALFAQVIMVTQQHVWPAEEPYFERLDIRIDLPGIEQALPVVHEVISSHEALHEDIYFSLMEVFQRRSGRAELDRRLQPGQIVPDIRNSDAPPRLRMQVSRFDQVAQDQRSSAAIDSPSTMQALHLLGNPVLPSQIDDEIEKMQARGGQAFQALSRQGRSVKGLYRAGSHAAVLISGGQHANETSGVVGALRAAQALSAQASAHFALIALENPDGYALHRELRVQHPLHMHHAARYSAMGDDIEYRDQAPFYEREARQQALALSGAQLHVNLHGYPAHEWTRPLCGYVPRGFELWTVPKGFFLILRHRSGWQTEARALLEHVSAALMKVPGLVDYNERQMALYQHHAGELPFEIINGVAYSLTEAAHGDTPVTLITEFPDETIEGDSFRFAHTVQMEAVLAAVEGWQVLAR